MPAFDRNVMRQAVSFPGAPVAGQREDGALPDEVGGGVVLIQLGEDRSERLARVQLERWLRILGVHVHHEVGVRGKERHLAFRIAAIGAMRVGLNELPDREAIGGLDRGEGSVFTHEVTRSPYDSRMARGSRNASIPYRPYSRPTPEYLNPPQGACGSSIIPLITTRPDRICDATRRARRRAAPRTAACKPYFESMAIRIAS